MTIKPRLSVVVPARAEGAPISSVLDRLFDSVRLPCEVIVVVDSRDDCTVPVLEAYAATEPRLTWLVNGYGSGLARAIRFGMDAARADVIVVSAADGSDDPTQIDELATLVEQGAAVAAASRYVAGGGHIGGLAANRLLSQAAGRSLQFLAHPGTCDATNLFKAYSAAFTRSVGIESRRGFAVGIELTAKARRLRLPVTEIPTRWVGRPEPRSGFRLIRWPPGYLRWYLFCFGRQLTLRQLPRQAGQPAS